RGDEPVEQGRVPQPSAASKIRARLSLRAACRPARGVRCVPQPRKRTVRCDSTHSGALLHFSYVTCLTHFAGAIAFSCDLIWGGKHGFPCRAKNRTPLCHRLPCVMRRPISPFAMWTRSTGRGAVTPSRCPIFHWRSSAVRLFLWSAPAV